MANELSIIKAGAMGHLVELVPADVNVSLVTFKALNDAATTQLIDLGGYRDWGVGVLLSGTTGVADGQYKISVTPYRYDGTQLGRAAIDLVTAIPLGATGNPWSAMDVAFFHGGQANAFANAGTVAASANTLGIPPKIKVTVTVTTATTSTTSLVSLYIYRMA